MGIVQSYTYTCDVCGKVAHAEVEQNSEDAVMPAGWLALITAEGMRNNHDDDEDGEVVAAYATEIALKDGEVIPPLESIYYAHYRHTIAFCGWPCVVAYAQVRQSMPSVIR